LHRHSSAGASPLAAEKAMSCANSTCHCQSEVFITRDGADYCSEACTSAETKPGAVCACGHAGCSAADEQRLLGAEPAGGRA
jgi:hypothetical protein